jgi:oxygen-independent coproporphyrinogen-3 oxidase
MSGLPSLSLYVHFPWCVAKCPYCDFNSHSLQGDLPGREYIDALIADLKASAPAVKGRTVNTIFFGGGTPSLFPPDELARLLEAVRAELVLAPDAEITLEANPGAVEHADFSGYRQAGINRLSLGVQSLDDAKLKSLGRIHSAADARHAFDEARAAGFDNINLDLMYALPEQTLDEALSDVEGVLTLRPEHISHYHLTLEPNTVFYAHPPLLPDDDLAWDIHMRSAEKLGESGYINYEVSAWARTDHECRHNLNYWHYGDYLGLGAGAHAKLTDGEQRWRETRAAHPREYLRGIHSHDGDSNPVIKRSAVSAPDARFEFMLNGLRLRDGFPGADFARLTGLPADSLDEGLDEARQRGLLEISAAGRIRPTEQGWRFLDDLQGIFLPQAPFEGPE